MATNRMHCAVVGVLFLFSCSDKVELKKKCDELYLKGKEAYLQKDFENAEKLFNEVIRIDKKYYNANIMISKIQFFEGNYDKALEKTNEVLKDDTNNIGALYWQSRILLLTSKEKENEDKAKTNLIKVLELDSSHVEAREMLALIFEKEGDYKDALSEYELIMGEQKLITDSRANLSILYRKIGVKQKSQEQIDLAIKEAELNKLDIDSYKKIKEVVSK